MKFSKRLKMISDLVPCSKIVCDVGTDHALLPVWLIRQQQVERAIATDVLEGPLAQAKKTIARFQMEHLIDLRLCDGLNLVQPTECDTIVIAGMGADIMIRILEQATWLHQGAHTLVLQPMTKAEELRSYLFQNGFRILREELTKEDRFYSAFQAKGGYEAAAQPWTECLLPSILQHSALYDEYREFLKQHYRQVADGIRRKGNPAFFRKSEEKIIVIERWLWEGQQ